MPGIGTISIVPILIYGGRRERVSCLFKRVNQPEGWKIRIRDKTISGHNSVQYKDGTQEKKETNYILLVESLGNKEKDYKLGAYRYF